MTNIHTGIVTKGGRKMVSHHAATSRNDKIERNAETIVLVAFLEQSL